MSDWEADYDEDGGAVSKPSRVHTAPGTQWKATSNNSKDTVCYGGRRGGKMDREGPQWRDWRERKGEEKRGREARCEGTASTRPLTLTLDHSFIGRVIG